MYQDIGGYTTNDIQFAMGFDIDYRKVNKTLAMALRAKPNCSMDHVETIDQSDNGCIDKNAMVYSAPMLDGMADHMSDYPDDVTFVNGAIPAESYERIVELLKYHKVDILINYLPVGSE